MNNLYPLHILYCVGHDSELKQVFGAKLSKKGLENLSRSSKN